MAKHLDGLKKVLNENEDVFQCVIEYANDQGLNVSDLDEDDAPEIAEYVSDELGRTVYAEEIENLILQEKEDMAELDDMNEDEDEEGSDEAPEENVELNDIELENPDVEEPEESEDDEEKAKMEKFSSMIRQSIAEEHEAAANYTKRAAKCEKNGMADAAAIFRSVAEEEIVHVGEFQSILEKYGLLNQDAVDQGEQEGNDIMGGDQEEPEIDAPEVPADDVENESVNEEFAGTVSNVSFDIGIAQEDQARAVIDHIQKALNEAGVKLLSAVNIKPYEDHAYDQKESAITEDQDAELKDYMDKSYNADRNCNFIVKSLLDGEQELEPRNYTERNIRNIYASYLMDEVISTDPEELDEKYKEIKDKAWNTPIEEIVGFLNNTGDMEVTMDDKDEDAMAGTIASVGEAPTAVAGKGIVTAEPTKLCEELKALQEALKD